MFDRDAQSALGYATTRATRRGTCGSRQYTQEAYLVAYTNPNTSAASNELERLSREWATLPGGGHVCTCYCCTVPSARS